MEQDLSMPLAEVLPHIQDGILRNTSYFGVKTLKSPMDAWVYQEILFEYRPDVIVEIGNACGGSALYLAHLCDILGNGRIIGLDLGHDNVPASVKEHPRITFIDGDACQNFARVEAMILPSERVLVIEDSSHTFENTLNVLRLYSKFTALGDYFIVEDSICHHGLRVGPDPGPYEAIEAFVLENRDFEIDRSREHFFLTWNPKGYLKRTALNHPHSTVPPLGQAAANDGKNKPQTREGYKPFVPSVLIRLLRTIFQRR
ncbi:MAG: CmcI family methyltransferase [Burkholderiales bacterium]